MYLRPWDLLLGLFAPMSQSSRTRSTWIVGWSAFPSLTSGWGLELMGKATVDGRHLPLVSASLLHLFPCSRRDYSAPPGATVPSHNDAFAGFLVIWLVACVGLVPSSFELFECDHLSPRGWGLLAEIRFTTGT